MALRCTGPPPAARRPHPPQRDPGHLAGPDGHRRVARRAAPGPGTRQPCPREAEGTARPAGQPLTRRLEGRLGRLKAQGTRGRIGAAGLMEVLEERRGRKRHVDSDLQRRFEEIALGGYRAGLLPEPFFEYPVQLADGRWRYPDVAYPPPVMVGFEAQSYEHHSTLEAFAADVERNLELFGEWWRIVPITGVQLRDPPKLVGLMARIIAAAQGRRG